MIEFPVELDSMIYGYSKYKNAFAKFSDETHPIYPRKLLA